MTHDNTAQPLVRGELQIFELPSRVELPVHVRRIRARHESGSTDAVSPATGKPLIERGLEELDVRIG